MGQGLSCGASDEHGLFRAMQLGNLALHIGAANGQIEVGSSLCFRFFLCCWNDL
ncbi:hypothetical protein RchiOBHm_Chr1g0313891 [Rosa chinensis]|uniref:Uncharacterized protein n=1 Tax=Rosa chinensis TaxID=74649 RepID=A0A2P6S724_ROSCH|nr:hypothetical protein RchiOBHm_Chr1g0313891 [Rosa chinensis]